MEDIRLRALLNFLVEDPEDPFLRFALASEYVKRDQLQEALKIFSKLIADEPGYVGTYFHLGKLLEKMQRLDEAIAVYRDGIDAATSASDTHAKAELQSALLEAEGFGFD
jgi:tetratricopeptide (TPR) repeat protein